jgi:hypothetical protein
MNDTPLVIRSGEVVDNLRDEKLNYDNAYPRAFGACWGVMTDEQRLLVLEYSERQAKIINELNKESN